MNRRRRREPVSPGAKAAGISFVAVVLAFAVSLWSITLPWEFWLILSGMVGIACAIIISGVRLGTLGAVLIGVFCFTASWDDVLLGPVNIRQLCLLLGGLLLLTTLDIRRLPQVPWWLHAYGLSAVIASAFQLLYPISQAYLDTRYASSQSGQSLGARAGALPSLASLLLNNYGVPVVIVLTCMALPGALKWLIGSYVTGAAFCCLAGILGYYGVPVLIDVFGGVSWPAGVRASGFTSHPLRLGTAALMALALACWMILQKRPALRRGGWGSLPLLVGGLYVSGSRGPILAGIVLLALCLFLLPDVRRRVHEVIGAVAIATLAFLFAFPSVIEPLLVQTRLTGDPTAAASDAGRSEVLAQGLDDFNTSPIFGIGIQFIAEAHTLYVGALAAGGLIFGAGFMLFNIGSMLTAIRSIAYDRALGGALVATLGAALFYWTVADLIQTKTVAIVFGFVVALWWLGEEESTASPLSHSDDAVESTRRRRLSAPRRRSDRAREARSPGNVGFRTDRLTARPSVPQVAADRLNFPDGPAPAGPGQSVSGG